MNDSITFKIIYDGESLRNHAMDVRDLAPALLSLSKLFDEANRVLNGNETAIKLQVKAQETGSFEIFFELYQSVSSQISHFLTGDFVVSAINLKELVLGGSAGLYWLIKKLKGGKPDKIIDLNNGFVRLEIDKETFEVSINLLRLYQDFAVRKATEEVLAPLNKEGIDTFKVKQKHQITTTVSKAEISYFTVPAVEEEKIATTENDAAYSIISLTFKEDNKWRLFDGNAVINVVIKDEDFKRKVDNNIISFAKGDILRCKVRTTQWRTQQGLKTDSEVLEVKEHIPAARQLLLFSHEENKFLRED